jgi:Zn-dependent protease with chaperone function
MGIIIEGLSREDNKKLYDAIEKEGNAYGLAKIKITTFADGFIINAGHNSIKVSEKMPEILNKGELEAAIAHEFSHICHRDPEKDILMAVPLVLLAILYTVLTDYYANNNYYWFILITPIVLIGVYFVGCIMLLHKWDRRCDREAVKKTSISAMIGMLEKRKEHVKGIDPFHPSINNRIKWIRESGPKKHDDNGSGM